MPNPPSIPDEALIRRSVSETLAQDVTAIAPVTRTHHSLPDIWKVTTDYHVLAVKRQVFASMARGTPYDLLEVEAELSGVLEGAVPRVVGSDADNDLVMLEWRGDRTLDDWCQDARSEGLSPGLVDAYCGIELRMAARADDLAGRCFPGCEPDALRASWRKAVLDVLGRLPQLAEAASSVGPDNRSVHLELPDWMDLIDRMAEAPPTLGAIDYNARNVVVDADGTFTFLEYSKIGWDWPERRLVRYGTSLGAGRSDALPVCVIDRAAAGRYSVLSAAWRGVSQLESLALLDAHHLVFHVMMLARLLQAVRLPISDPRRAAWPNVDERLKGANEAIRVRLSEDVAVGVLRETLLA